MRGMHNFSFSKWPYFDVYVNAIAGNDKRFTIVYIVKFSIIFLLFSLFISSIFADLVFVKLYSGLLAYYPITNKTPPSPTSHRPKKVQRDSLGVGT